MSEHDLGLGHDLRTLDERRMLADDPEHPRALTADADEERRGPAGALNRRQLLRIGGGVGAAALVTACVPTGTGTPSASIPEETAGPYPGDGTNGPNALATSGIVRRDIRSSFGSSTTVAPGVPTTVYFTVLDAATHQPMKGAAVYLWHCDRSGGYSLYSSGLTNENYLRGVQATNSSGVVSFLTIFPACYSGRWPHMHFEVFPSLASATNGSQAFATSQIALPKATCDKVYATSGYEQSVANLTQVSLATDMVFSDGTALETPAVAGNVTTGLVVALSVAVNT